METLNRAVRLNKLPNAGNLYGAGDVILRT
jgi:hypothetical protein